MSAVLSGAALAAAFPPLALGPICFAALVPVTVALHRRPRRGRAFFWTGYVFGVTFFLGHLWWVVRLDAASSITIPWLMAPALFLLVVYLALYPALFFWLLGRLGRRRPAAVVLIGPALWMLLELFRSSGELGFSWGAIGYALAGEPGMMQLAAQAGVFGMGALVVLVNMIWSAALLYRGTGVRLLLLVAGAAVFGGNLVLGSRAVASYDAVTRDGRVRTAVVQPNVDLDVKWDPAFTDSTLRLIERMTRQASVLAPELIVLPETCAPVYMRRDAKYRSTLTELSSELGVSIFIGFLDGRKDGPGGTLNIYNSSGLFSPDGGLVLYDKRHLLPFGEAIPFAWKFRSLSNIEFGQANFQPGPRTEPIASPAGRIAPFICFESIFPWASRRSVLRGADVLVNITNDGWFGDTPGPYQHRDMAIFRAVENRRFLLRSANTGVSMVVDPMGRVVDMLDLDRQGILVGSVHRVAERTLYTRAGEAPAVVIALALAAVGVFVARAG